MLAYIARRIFLMIPTLLGVVLLIFLLFKFFGGDPAFFTNIHPNSRCLSLIAQWETEALLNLFGGNPSLL